MAVTRQRISIHKKQLPLLLLVGVVGYALTNLLYTYAILLTQVGTVLFIFYGLSAVMPITASVFLKEKITPAKIWGLSLGLVALFFLFRPGPVDTWKVGAIFAFLSAVAQGVYVIGRKKLHAISSSMLLLVNTTLGVISVGVISLILEYSFYSSPSGLAALSCTTWITTIVFGIGNFFAWLFLTKGFQLVSAGTGSLVMLSENFIGVLFAFMFFGEIPSLWTFVGGLLVLAASIIAIAEPRKK
jgi:drug/metabolite transporter (DMT)-like permease